MHIYKQHSLLKSIIRKFSQIKPKTVPKRPIYLDFQSTTPLDFRVLDKMMPFQINCYGNPHSRTHEYGWQTEKAVQDARKNISDLINADPKEIIFTSGATESNNAALKGLTQFHGKKKKHIITTQIEHKCILDTCRNLEEQGFEVTYLPVDKNGLVNIETFKKALRNDTLVASVIFVHNEIGVVQDMKQLGQICRENKVYFHTDASQALGKVPINVDELNIDLMSITSHKIYGPKGIGALYVRRKPKVRILPIINGGGQERGLRSGTLAPHLCVGFGEACAIAKLEMKNDNAHVNRLSNLFMDQIKKQIPNIYLNGDNDRRYKGNINISFAFVEGESLIMGIKQCAVSSGSACTSASLEPSYVLRALGVDEELAHTSLRIGIGRFTTEEEINYLVQVLVEKVTSLREMSPLWEMVQQGIDIKQIQWSQPH
ncbi:tRNA splicing protein, putative [Ichthyophthirius multifiliis]|uniref:cysteine desulfurase n=1 Tax=Ichthyophthirius multifiliis TaxID=5932 RepID=G0QMZ7_ICHMU|nr:tRNA splicing protein, putative [Ichthyophthirius multifiliis]EGR33412.1 tRNA splicing protein, putative [Ichthyophthirius multifiliis]|eukprot:XP_004037398.1 tRNA splicing protein, putative [Ichthyophthirius multifiliis]